jgi:hypothetical protein
MMMTSARRTKELRPKAGNNLNIHHENPSELILLYNLQSCTLPCYFLQTGKLQSQFLNYSFTHLGYETTSLRQYLQ